MRTCIKPTTLIFGFRTAVGMEPDPPLSLKSLGSLHLEGRPPCRPLRDDSKMKIAEIKRYETVKPKQSWVRVALGLGLLLTSNLTAAQVSLSVQANRTTIYLGESVQLHVKVNGISDRGIEPRFPGLKEAELEPLGSQDNSSRSVQIVNGRLSQQVFHGRTFVYRLTPQRAGTFQVGTVEVDVQGQYAAARGPAIQVTGIEQRQDIAVVTEATRETILVGEPFTVTLSIRVAPLPAPNDSFNPIHPNRPPHLQVDFLELEPIHGLQSPDLKALLEGLVAQGGREATFQINNYRSQGMGGFMGMGFGNMFEPQPIPFRLPSKRIDINGRAFWEYSLSLAYTAQLEGEYTFGPATFKGPFITGGDARGQPILEEVFIVGPAVTVRVVPPPEAGRPECFIGSVGRNLKAEAQIDTALCKVGDPLTLTLDLTGEISLSNLRPPILGLQAGLTNNFRVYGEPHATETLSNGKRFRYRIRPLKSGTLEFPALPVAYFDTESMQYVTVYTLPLPIQARATTQIAAISEDADDDGETRALTVAEKLPDGIILSLTGQPGPHPLALTPRRVMCVFFGPPAGFLLIVLLRAMWRRRHAWSAHRRGNRALAQARRSFKRARHAAVNDPAAGAILGAQAFRAYCSARLAVAADGVTAGDLSALFRTHRIPDDISASIPGPFVELEQLPFRPHAATEENVIDLLNRLLNCLIQIDRHLSKTKPQPRPLQLMVLLMGLALLVPSLTRASRLDDTFNWDRANQAMAGAQTTAEFLQSARLYNDMILAGTRTGPLFYNLGTALLLAGDARDAEAALVRAERYLGATPEIRTNLKLAIAARTGQPDAALPPSRIFFAWHYFLSLEFRIWLLLSGWLLFWCGLALRLTTQPPASKFKPTPRRRAFANLLTGWGCALILLYGSSVAFTFVQEQHDTRFWRDRVFATANSHALAQEGQP